MKNNIITKLHRLRRASSSDVRAENFQNIWYPDDKKEFNIEKFYQFNEKKSILVTQMQVQANYAIGIAT